MNAQPGSRDYDRFTDTILFACGIAVLMALSTLAIYLTLKGG